MNSVDVVDSTWIDSDGVEVKVKDANAYSVYFDWLNHPLFDSDIAADHMSVTGFKARFKRKPSAKAPVMPGIGTKWQSKYDWPQVEVVANKVAFKAVNDSKKWHSEYDLDVFLNDYTLLPDDSEPTASQPTTDAFLALPPFTPASASVAKTCEPIPSATLPPKAVQILNEAVSIMAERGKSYDKSGGQAERSMPKIVAMFNALTGHELTPAQGWKFMACLKLARSEQGEHREDNYLDGAAYFALAGEEAGESEQ